VEEDWEALSRAPPWIREDREVIRAALARSGYALEFAAPELRADWDLVLTALEADGCALEFAAEELQADRELVLFAVEQDGSALEFAAQELKNDRTIVLVAVRENGRALRFAEQRLRADRGVVLAAVKQNPSALEFAAEQARADRKVVLRAVQDNADIIRFASPELRTDQSVIAAAMQEDKRQSELQRLAVDSLKARVPRPELHRKSAGAGSNSSMPSQAKPNLAPMEAEERLAYATHWYMEAGNLMHRWAGIQLPQPPPCSTCLLGRHLWCRLCGPASMADARQAMAQVTAADKQMEREERRLMKKFLGSGLYFTDGDLHACAFKGNPR